MLLHQVSTVMRLRLLKYDQQDHVIASCATDALRLGRVAVLNGNVTGPAFAFGGSHHAAQPAQREEKKKMGDLREAMLLCPRFENKELEEYFTGHANDIIRSRCPNDEGVTILPSTRDTDWVTDNQGVFCAIFKCFERDLWVMEDGCFEEHQRSQGTMDKAFLKLALR